MSQTHLQFGGGGGRKLRAQSCQGSFARVVEQRSALYQALFHRHAVSPKMAVAFDGLGECLKVRIHGGFTQGTS